MSGVTSKKPPPSPSKGGLFITGTDTGVGKTVVTAALALALRGRGLRVGVMKPVESGCPRVNGTLLPQDAVFLREASGSTMPLELINPYALERPLAPALAAEMEGVSIQLDRIEAAYCTLASAHDFVLVEGAGGLLAPLTGELRMVELACALGLPVLVVARNVLGAINHASLTVEAARGAGLQVAGVVLNNPSPADGAAEGTNAASLRRWVSTPFLGEMSYLPSMEHQGLLRAAEAALAVGALVGKGA